MLSADEVSASENQVDEVNLNKHVTLEGQRRGPAANSPDDHFSGEEHDVVSQGGFRVVWCDGTSDLPKRR